MKRKFSALLPPLPPRSAAEETHNIDYEESFNARKRQVLIPSLPSISSELINAVSKKTSAAPLPPFPIGEHYETLTKSLANSRRRRISRPQILQILNRFNAEDHRERAALGALLQDIYEKFEEHRVFIRKSVYNVLYEFNSSSESEFNGIPELLNFIARVVENREAVDLEEEFRVFLLKSLIPLYKSKWLVKFYPQLRNCIWECLIRDRELAGSVLLGMKKFWPKQGSSREYFFLDAAECYFTEARKDRDFTISMTGLVEKIASCISSTNFFVAGKALGMLDPSGGLGILIKTHFRRILPIIFPKVKEAWEEHWRKETRELAEKIVWELARIDTDFFSECYTANSLVSKDEDETLESNWDFLARDKRWEELKGLGDARMKWNGTGISSKSQLSVVLASS